jgi:hypothetical protein
VSWFKDSQQKFAGVSDVATVTAVQHWGSALACGFVFLVLLRWLVLGVGWHDGLQQQLLDGRLNYGSLKSS